MAPSPMNSQSETDSLLPPKAQEASTPLPPTASTGIKALAIIRLAIGASCLIAPRWSCALFRFHIPADMTILSRMVGARDLILGDLLITAENKQSADRGRREIKRALWASIGADCLDIGCILFGVATGTVEKLPAVLLGGAAIASIGLGVSGLGV